jgi:hypothetical protein
MKKFLIVVASVILGTTGVMSLMNNNNSNLDLAKENISEVRYNLFAASTDEVSATLMTGEREDPYILDGIANDLVDFGIIDVTFKEDTTDYVGTPTFRLTVGDNFIDGELEESPFEKDYIADIKTQVDTENQVFLLVEWNDLYQTLEMNPVSPDWECDWEASLELAIEEIEGRNFNRLVENGELKAEVHVMIVAEPEVSEDTYYWYVNIYGRDGSRVTIVIDPTNCEILTRRVVIN